MRIRHHIVGLIALVALTLTPASAAPAAPATPPEPQPIAVVPIDILMYMRTDGLFFSIAACPRAHTCTATLDILTSPLSELVPGMVTDIGPEAPDFSAFASQITDGIPGWIYTSPSDSPRGGGGNRAHESYFFGDEAGPDGFDLWGSQIGHIRFQLDAVALSPYPLEDGRVWTQLDAHGTLSFYPPPLSFQISCSDATGYGVAGERLYWQVEFINPNYSPNRVSRGVVAAGRTFNPQVRWRTPLVSGESADASYYRWWIWRGGHYGELIASSEGHFFCATAP